MFIHKHHGTLNTVPRTGTIKYIVVHYTGSGTSKAGSAKANCIYFSRGYRAASAHYFIDDSGIWEYADPSKSATWHVGDGRGRYGITNQNSIGIEVCNNGGPYTQTEIGYLTTLVQQLMGTYGVPASRVVRHYDASRKACPYPYAPNGEDPTGAKWASLHRIITGGKPAAKPHTKPAPKAKAAKLDVDGYFGPATIKALQRYLGTPADGVISSQYAPNKRYVPSATVGWEWSYRVRGSLCVKALQRKTGAIIDSIWGKDTSRAVQRWLGVDTDGYFGDKSTRALQRKLNEALHK